MSAKGLLVSLAVVVLLSTVAPTFVEAVDFSTPVNINELLITNPQRRRLAERRILDSTVRMMVESWTVLPNDAGYDIQYSVGHAAVMHGRYLVSHNHFHLPLSIRPGAEGEGSYGIVTLYNSGGEQVYKGPLSDYRLVLEEPQTLVFAHEEDGFFTRLGFTSADFRSWDSLPLEPGSLVAQVDWDGATTRVDWVEVQEVKLAEGAPRLVLADGVMPGASGGGIFWQGTHVANNWRLEEQIAASGDVVAVVTAVALNSAALLDL